jgi:hypothetical protein
MRTYPTILAQDRTKERTYFVRDFTLGPLYSLLMKEKYPEKLL